METSLFILGFLLRYGSMHGYKLKQLIDEQAADFTSIKTSNLYYHLNKMMDKGYIKGEKQPQSEKPDKITYTITEEGKKEFKNLLSSALNKSLNLNFSFDNALFFHDYLKNEEYKNTIETKLSRMKQLLKKFRKHKQFAFSHVPDNYKKYAEMIFSHHEVHIEAEIDWLKKIRSKLN